MTTTTLTPFIKWVGGKRQLLTQLTARIPTTIRHYYEPFIGGGALLFHLKPRHAHINDTNPILIHTYNTIKHNPTQLIDHLNQLDQLEPTNTVYNTTRDRFNNHIRTNTTTIETAALFIFLNKRSFNGLYRVNRHGLFNVPYNNKPPHTSYDPNNIYAISRYLQTVTITNTDFATSLTTAQPGDFIFLDPPYAPLTPTSFTAYTKNGFTQDDQRRLADTFNQLDNQGCLLMTTNHDTELVRTLYTKHHIEPVNVTRAINRDGNNRTGNEVIITNYTPRQQ